jgi:GGDEF domain-containing protein
VEVGDDVVHPSASVGYALIDQDCQSAEQVLVEADRAMYSAKRAKHAQTA